ncbi:hypothetical protein [Streptomyces sp. SYSU K217416]
MVSAQQPVMGARQPEHLGKAALAAAHIAEPHGALTDASAYFLAITRP